MTLLLAFLLIVGLPWVETNVTVTERVGALRCHVCERENEFQCTRPATCPENTPFCSTAAVRMFVRFFYVSRQCSKYCPLIQPNDMMYKPFILIKPMPFLYAKCCRKALCNVDAPVINDTELNYYREARRAGDMRSDSAGLVLFLTLSSVSLGLGLS